MLVVLEDIFQMITFEVSGTSYLPFVHEMAMTTRRQRHGLSKLAEEIATLTISNGMCSHAGATGRKKQKALAESAPNAQDQRSSKDEEPRVIRLKEVIKKVGLSRSTIYNLIEDGRFPQRLQLLERAIGFYEHEVDAWILQLGRKA
ncbi:MULTISPECIES: helix-turn-helix transcriptional regulator [unclassified Undibacterium]|uniref:helix-turn-helix transcriptional regulator n=1 Tax=unclassified Undibacterium TaxID=2630295 RepID=UPI003C2B8834